LVSAGCHVGLPRKRAKALKLTINCKADSRVASCVNNQNIMNIEYLRAFRTSSSERFFLRYVSIEFGCLELHYLANGTVQALLVIYDDATRPTEDIGLILKHIDDVLLPEVSLEDSKLLYSVFTGRAAGSFAPVATPLVTGDDVCGVDHQS
jgi:hypothetical protein